MTGRKVAVGLSLLSGQFRSLDHGKIGSQYRNGCGSGEPMKWIKSGKAAIMGLADATYGAASFVSKHEDSISGGVRFAIEATGRAVAKAGAVIPPRVS